MPAIGSYAAPRASQIGVLALHGRRKAESARRRASDTDVRTSASHSARRICQNGIKHRLRSPGDCDDLEHIGGGSLLLQRFESRALQLVEQPRVLDGDDGLRGEILDQLDLLVGERANLLAVDDDCADEFIVLSIGTASNVRAPASLASVRAGVSGLVVILRLVSNIAI